MLCGGTASSSRSTRWVYEVPFPSISTLSSPTEHSSFSRPFLLTEGVPQGGVLSGLLFSLALNDITLNVPSSVHISLYTNDVLPYASGPPFRLFNVASNSPSTNVPPGSYQTVSPSP